MAAVNFFTVGVNTRTHHLQIPATVSVVGYANHAENQRGENGVCWGAREMYKDGTAIRAARRQHARWGRVRSMMAWQLRKHKLSMTQQAVRRLVRPAV
jgi:hypothetical protein